MSIKLLEKNKIKVDDIKSEVNIFNNVKSPYVCKVIQFIKDADNV